MIEFVVRAILGAFVGWVALGAVIGIAAALLKRVPVIVGIVIGALLGPLAVVLFYAPGEYQGVRTNRNVIFTDTGPNTRRSQYALRRCPECTGPNDYLTWVASVPEVVDRGVPVLWGAFVAPEPTYRHHYRCDVCGYQWQFKSRSADADTTPQPTN